MENKKAAILVLAIAAAVAITASGAYAMGRQTGATGYSHPSTTFGSWMGPGMMGGYGGQPGGMMGGYGGYPGMMGSSGYSLYQYMQHHWNSTSVP